MNKMFTLIYWRNINYTANYINFFNKWEFISLIISIAITLANNIGLIDSFDASDREEKGYSLKDLLIVMFVLLLL